MTYGAKGLLYFCYFTPPPHNEFIRGQAIITRDGRKTRHYRHAQMFNKEIHALGKTLMKLTCKNVYHAKPDDDASEVLKDTPVKKIINAPEDPIPEYLVGVFKHEDGRDAFMISNYNYQYTLWPAFEFEVPVEKIAEIDKATGEEVPVIDENPNLDGTHIPLDAGEGRLFIVSK